MPAGSEGRPRPVLVLAVALAAARAGDAANPPSRQWSARAAAAAGGAYRGTISPWLGRTHLVTCRFTPTCSAYALEALRRRGFFPGAALGLARIVRCNPWSQGGDDPVP